MREVFRQLRLIRGYDVPVLLSVKAGRERNWFARAIHRESSRADKPFIALNCAAFPDQLVESLLFGHVRAPSPAPIPTTLGSLNKPMVELSFLDEVDETSRLPRRVNFCGFLQDGDYYRVGETRARKTDIRLIAAGKPTLPSQAESGVFRQDLYYRMKVVQIQIPPLRERARRYPATNGTFLSPLRQTL